MNAVFESPPHSWSGHAFADGEMVRLIYTDEAGISAKEPVTVVAGIMVHGDTQFVSLQREIARLITEKVPQNIQDGFWIHATEIYSGGSTINRDEWPFDERLGFLKEVLRLPFVHDVPIAIGIDFKEKRPKFKQAFRSRFSIPEKITPAQLSHFIAFTNCMERADWFLRDCLGGKEIATVVAEDTREMRELLTKHGLLYRDNPILTPKENIFQGKFEKDTGVNKKDILKVINHIVDVPHFVSKKSAPMLQIADVCAFALRRYLSGGSNGADLVLAMLGQEVGQEFIDEPEWFRGSSHGVFNIEHLYPDKLKKNLALWRSRRAAGRKA